MAPLPCGSARGGSICAACCAGASNLPGDRRCADWAGRTPDCSSRMLMPSFSLFLPHHMIRCAQEKPRLWSLLASVDTLSLREEKNTRGERKSFSVCHMELRVHFAHGRQQVAVNHNSDLNLQMTWVYSGSITVISVYVACNAVRKTRVPCTVPHPLFIPQQLHSVFAWVQRGNKVYFLL